MKPRQYKHTSGEKIVGFEAHFAFESLRREFFALVWPFAVLSIVRGSDSRRHQNHVPGV